MARKLSLHLTVEQARLLHTVATHHVASAADPLLLQRWQAIERETSRALAFDAARETDDGTT